MSQSEKVLAAQLCPTLCDSMDCSPPDSAVHGTLQARCVSQTKGFQGGQTHRKNRKSGSDAPLKGMGLRVEPRPHVPTQPRGPPGSGFPGDRNTSQKVRQLSLDSRKYHPVHEMETNPGKAELRTLRREAGSLGRDRTLRRRE